jgi:hypothetical protein
MFKVKKSFNYVVIITMLLGLVIGCGASAEQQALSDFLTQYEKAVEEYAAADNSKKAELREKLDSYEAKWTDLKMEIGSEITPQTLDKLEIEHRKITEKYRSLVNKS